MSKEYGVSNPRGPGDSFMSPEDIMRDAAEERKENPIQREPLTLPLPTFTKVKTNAK